MKYFQSIYKGTHLLLALLSSVFLLIASITGVIIAIFSIFNTSKSEVRNLEITSIQSLVSKAEAHYEEVYQIKKEKNNQITIKALDHDFNEIQGVISVNDAKIQKNLEVKNDAKSQFLEQVIAFHRSLFLHEAGRLIMAIVSLLLFLLLFSGTLLIYKRKADLKSFFLPQSFVSWQENFHVLGSKFFFIPLLLLSITGVGLYYFPNDLPIAETSKIELKNAKSKFPNRFQVFQDLTVADLETLDFPFSEDESEFYTLITKDHKLTIDQFNGKIVSAATTPQTNQLRALFLTLHTGGTGVFWIFILAFASLSLPLFIYTGFTLFLKRKTNPISESDVPSEAEFVVLVGTEGGSTHQVASHLYNELKFHKRKVFFGSLNQYQHFPEAKFIFIFTSTYGDGEAPTNANQFLEKLVQNSQNHAMKYSILAFGSKSFRQFCAFGYAIEKRLKSIKEFSEEIPLTTVNNFSITEINHWMVELSSNLSLGINPFIDTDSITNTAEFSVVDKSLISSKNNFFLIQLLPVKKIGFQSGDLLKVYLFDEKEYRFYSISEKNKNIQLLVREHPHGRGSTFLSSLSIGDTIQSDIISQKRFHIHKSKPVIFISNGTGIAPFLGMLTNLSTHHRHLLFSGLRYDDEISEKIKNQIELERPSQLSPFYSFSREENGVYITELFNSKFHLVAELMNQNGLLMICGSLSLLQDCNQIWNNNAKNHHLQSFQTYLHTGQIVTDCY